MYALPLLLIYLFQSFTDNIFAQSGRIYFWILVAQFIVFRVLVFTWQSVGIVRAADKAYVADGNVIRSYAIYGAVLIGIAMLFMDAIHIVHISLEPQRSQAQEDARDAMESRDYSLFMCDAGDTLHVSGYFDFGLSRDIARILIEHSTINTVVLDSLGGPVSEGRGVAKLLMDRELNTWSSSGCASACVIAFAGGKLRGMDANAKLGLHRYRLDATNTALNIDVSAEMEADLKFLSRRGIDIAAIEQGLKSHSETLWFPKRKLLENAGFLNRTETPAPPLSNCEQQELIK